MVTLAGFAAFTNIPPFQTIAFPLLVPVSIELGVIQEILLLLDALTSGGVVFPVIITESIAVQPFPESVTVTVYVPAAVTVAGFAAFTKAPPFQTIVFPELFPVNMTLDVMQERLLLPDAVITGGVLFAFTIIESIDEHPELLSVTVKV